ncbi:site-specific integrase [Lacticaseibacillus sharpeae]|uniref:Site-specific recombinase xerd n=1 Tax=Lacticaseibacillus sharpeae JCM 1186 = DSM 20505 TaxID=1291052 RepID=A0A0R1ZV69_9LACO|nr:site-specific integrase [Lacticaseibacillus sharpeae]KRM55673.1 site-specific recombinase xerd [Lacticaseibacillus sharpeae JCM 1186 = DSM 20505]
MKEPATPNTLFQVYFKDWVDLYKAGGVREVTLSKYYITQQQLIGLVPTLTLNHIDRKSYQSLLNEYALTHERQTTMDFHHQLKACIMDAVAEGLVNRDPTRKAVIKGKSPAEKKTKFLSQFELHAILNDLDLGSEPNWDWLILLIAKTGLRFAEALAVTPKDFDFTHQTLNISKTWNYKSPIGKFQPTKNKSSKRVVQIDWQTTMQFAQLVKGLPEDNPIFVHGRVFNSTVNGLLERHCRKCNVPVISIHGLRHTHASLLLFAGVSIASVARRLGHSNMTTTQQTYLHIIQELENQDNDKVMRYLSGLN